MENFDLWNNYFRYVFLFCNEVNKGENLYLKYFILVYIKIIYIFLNSFFCFFFLEILDLSYIDIKSFEDNIFSLLWFLKELKIGYVLSLKLIVKYVFNSFSLVILKFYYNDFDFGNILKYLLKYIFKFCFNLRILDFCKNYFLIGFYS